MSTTYKTIARAIAILVALQAAFIAAGVFGLFSAVEDHGLVVDAESMEADPAFTGAIGFMLHAMGAMLIVFLSLVLMGLSFALKRGAPKWAGIVLGLAVLQYALGWFSASMPSLGALHGLNAFALFAMALVAARKVDETTDEIELNAHGASAGQERLNRST